MIERLGDLCVCMCVCESLREKFVFWFLEGFGFCVYERDVYVLVSFSQFRWGSWLVCDLSASFGAVRTVVEDSLLI